MGSGTDADTDSMVRLASGTDLCDQVYQIVQFQMLIKMLSKSKIAYCYCDYIIGIFIALHILSLYVCPNVITLSGFRCTSPNNTCALK